MLQNGGSQADIDALAASQDKAAGRSSKVAGYAQMGGPGSSDDVYDSNFSNKLKYQKGDFTGGLEPVRRDNTNINVTPTIPSYQNRLESFVDRDRSIPVTEEMLEGVRGPGYEKLNFAKNFKQTGDFNDATYYDTPASYFGPNEDMVRYNTEELERGDSIPVPSMEEVDVYANDETTTVTPSGNTTTPTTSNSTTTPNSSTLGDAFGLASSMAAPIAAYTSTPGVMPGVGSITPVEAEVLKYGNRNDVRARNENDFQKVVQYIKTTGGGPADMINMMSAYGRKMTANAAVTAEEEREHIDIDNKNADRRQTANQINTANEIQMTAFKQAANKTNLLLAEDAKANKIEALQTASSNIVTANRDKKAFEASTLMANAIDGGSGVLGRALSPTEQQKAINDYMEKGIVLNSSEVDEQIAATSVPEVEANTNAVTTVQTAVNTDAATAQEIVNSNNNMTMANAFLGKNETKHTELLTQIITNYAGTAKIDDPSKTAWCAAFTGSILNMNGYDHEGTASARSFAEQGTEVESEDYQVGDVVVLWRDPKENYNDSAAARTRSDNSNTGHVGFYAGTDADGNILVLGGNQGAEGGGGVTQASFASDRILSVRRFS